MSALVAVVAARALFHLPYHLARMSVVRRGDEVRYASERSSPRGARGFAGRYRPLGPVFRSEPGSIDAWLTERYCLYAADRRGRLHRGEVHHEPWPLQRAEVEIERDTLSADLGLRYGPRPLVHFARRLDVVAWALRPAE